MQPSSVYQEHFGFVWSSLRRFGVAVADLEDATHDAFVVVYRRRAEFARASSPRGWLFGVVRRVASNHRRRARRRERRLAAVRDVGPRATRPERDLERTDASRVVRRFLEGLTEPQRDVFVLAELHQMTANEVGELLDINPNTASARLRAARKAFARFAQDVREQNAWDGEAALVQLQRPARPSREARQRVGSALAVSLGSATTGAAASGLGIWAKAAAVAVLLGGGTVGVLAGGAAAMRGGPPPVEVAASGGLPPSSAEASDSEPSLTTPPASSAREGSGALADSSPVAPVPRPHPTNDAGGRASRVSAIDRASAARAPATPSPKDVAATSTAELDAQTRLLARARRALSRDDAVEVQRLATEYRERYGAGPFLAEIELLEIRGRCAGGDTSAARALGERFRRAHPGSSHLAMIDKTCAVEVTKIEGSGD